MAAEILVMCAACGRPQFAKQTHCVACGQPLPETPAVGREVKAQLNEARDRILDAYQPFLEGTLGKGRRLLLSEKRLEWHAGVAPAQLFELSQLKRVTLERRPVYEALIFTGLALAVALAVPQGWVKLPLLGLALFAAVSCFAQKRYTLKVERAEGAVGILLGIGTRRAPISQRIESVWGTVRASLERLGVSTEPIAVEKGGR